MHKGIIAIKRASDLVDAFYLSMQAYKSHPLYAFADRCHLGACNAQRQSICMVDSRGGKAHRKREEIKDFCTITPGICIAIFPLALVKEAIHLRMQVKVRPLEMRITMRGRLLASTVFSPCSWGCWLWLLPNRAPARPWLHSMQAT